MTTLLDWAPPLSEWIDATLRAKDVPGGAVALSRDGSLDYAHGFGRRDLDANLPADIDTVFGVGSVTKSFTCLAIMQLAEANRLSPADPVRRYLPDLHLWGGQPSGAITIQHLMTHCAGLPPMPARHYAALAEMTFDEHERAEINAILDRFPPHEPIHSYDELIGFLAEHRFRLHGAPGERFSYSNEGYALLGAIIERVSGRRYEDYVEERILQPVAMSRSTVGLERLPAMDNVTAVYARHDGAVYHSPGWFHARAIIPTGQVRSTVRDLIRYLEAYRNDGRAEGGRILSPAGIAQMTSGQARIDSRRQYGYGWVIESDWQGLRAIEHGGGHKGVAAYVGYLPEAALSCAVLTNLAGAPAGQIWDRCLRAILGLPAESRHPAVTVPYAPEQLAGLTGVYLSEEGNDEIRVAVENGQLVITRGDERQPARPISENRFALTVEGQEQEIHFLAGQTGRASHIFCGLRLVPRKEDGAAGAL